MGRPCLTCCRRSPRRCQGRSYRGRLRRRTAGKGPQVAPARRGEGGRAAAARRKCLTHRAAQPPPPPRRRGHPVWARNRSGPWSRPTPPESGMHLHELHQARRGLARSRHTLPRQQRRDRHDCRGRRGRRQRGPGPGASLGRQPALHDVQNARHGVILLRLGRLLRRRHRRRARRHGCRLPGGKRGCLARGGARAGTPHRRARRACLGRHADVLVRARNKKRRLDPLEGRRAGLFFSNRWGKSICEMRTRPKTQLERPTAENPAE
jgi:hypothetical protein